MTKTDILRKTNMRTAILSRKDQVNIKKDNKNTKMLKNKLWKMRISRYL